MEIIRNLSGVQKGLLAGLILGVMVIYLCLCLSAVGVIPVAPGLAPGGLLAQVPTATPLPPTAAPTVIVVTGEPPSSGVAAPVAAEPTQTETPTPTPTETATLAPTATPMLIVMPALTATSPASPTPSPTVISKATKAPATLKKPVATDTPPAPTPTPEWTWQGVEYERASGTKTNNVFGVLAVRVVGVPDRKIFIREVVGGWTTTLVTGRKPQYGDFSDDVGGLSPSTYQIKVMDIDAEVQVKLGPGDFVLVEFALHPPAGWTPEPTQKAKAAVTVMPVSQKTTVAKTEKATPAGPTPETGWAWKGVEFQRTNGTTTHNTYGVIAVRVVGVPDRKVFIREASGGWTGELVTGRKPEYGDFSDDVGGLSAGTYYVKPMDIDSEFQVKLKEGDFVLVEFALHPTGTLTPEPTKAKGAAPPVPAAKVTVVATAKKPLAAAPQAAATAGAAPASSWVWKGIEYERIPGTKTNNVFGILAVRVVGVPDRKVFIREVVGGWTTTLVTGRKPEYGNFSDDVGGLEPSTYRIKPMDIDDEVEVKLGAGDFVLVEFALRPPVGWTPETTTEAKAAATVAPTKKPAAVAKATKTATPSPEPTGAASPAPTGGWVWQGVEYERTPGIKTGNAAGVLAVRIVGVPDRKVTVREMSGGWTTTLVTGRKPEYGDFSDDVGGLAPSTYSVKPMDIDAEVQVKMGQGDFVLVEFALHPPSVVTPTLTVGAPAPKAGATQAAPGGTTAGPSSEGKGPA